MAWYDTKGSEKNVVISSRIRFARNIADYPFALKLDPASASEINEKVKSIFGGKDYEIIDFGKLGQIEKRMYTERHLASPEYETSRLPGIIVINKKKNLSIMVCEEDHVRLQCITSGFSLDEAYEAACGADDIICEKLNIAYDEKLGFLTHCPTNIGTGMRASVMMFLPALTISKEINKMTAPLLKFGLAIRGLYGEGSNADGYLYQISNQVTLGLTEEDTINKLSEIIKEIIFRENLARGVLKTDNPGKLTDIIMRSYGILNYAHMISSEEFIKLYADVRLGISLGYIKDIDYEELDALMISVMPANLIKQSDRELSNGERDIFRAKYVKNKLKEITKYGD